MESIGGLMVEKIPSQCLQELAGRVGSRLDYMIFQRGLLPNYLYKLVV